MNEENVKINVILPFLQSLGFDKNNLSFEDKFTIKWGHKGDTIDAEKNAKSPRSDILVKDTEKDQALFVMEIKKDEQDLIDDDKWQAISYARMMLPAFCPYVVLTNGKDTKIYDAFTGDEIKDIEESSFVKAGYKLQLNDEIQSEAISKLITLSYDNLHTLCQYQVDDILSRFVTTDKTKLKNYIDEVYVPRNSILSVFDSYLADDESTCFLINGNSGVGKTNLMCNLAKIYQDRYPVLFVSASQLSANLDHFIADEFNWNFSTHKYPEQYIKQLHTILEKHDTKLLLFVDAIDEWSIDNAEVKLSEFVNKIPGKRIKLILTCKKTRSLGFRRINAVPLALSQHLYQIDEETIPSISLDKFTNEELMEVKEKSEKYFSFSNEITGDTLEKCRDPALLRAVCETYQGNEVPNSLNSVEIWQKFLENKLEKAGESKSQVLEHLKKIADVMFDEHCDEIFESDIADIDHEANKFCKDYGILIEKPDETGRSIIRFEFEGLRNFIITYHLAKLDTLDPSQLEEFAKNHILKPCGKEIIQWFDSNAKEEQHEVLAKVITKEDKNRAQQFIEKLINFAKNDFPSIWKFEKSIGKAVGLLVLYNEKKNFVMRYGFRRITAEQEKVIWLEKNDWEPFSDKKELEIITKHKSSFLGFTDNDFTRQSPESFAFETALGFTNEQIKQRRLDETKNVGIAIEKLFTVAKKAGIILGLPNYEKNYLEKLLPLDLTKIKDYLGHYYDPSDPEAGQYGGIILQTHYPHYTISNREIDQICDTIISKNKILESTLLPQPDNPKYPEWYHLTRAKDFSEAKLIEYTKKFFENVINEYKVLVDTNFPTIKSHFPTYKKLPVYIIAKLQKSNKSTEIDGMMYAFLKNSKDVNEVEIRGVDDDPINIQNPDDLIGFLFETKNGLLHTTSYTSGSMIDFLFSSYTDSTPFENSPVTSMVYDLVKDDLKTLYGKKYHMSFW